MLGRRCHRNRQLVAAAVHGKHRAAGLLRAVEHEAGQPAEVGSVPACDVATVVIAMGVIP